MAVVDRIQLQSRKFAKGVNNKVTGDSLNDSPNTYGCFPPWSFEKCKYLTKKFSCVL